MRVYESSSHDVRNEQSRTDSHRSAQAWLLIIFIFDVLVARIPAGNGESPIGKKGKGMTARPAPQNKRAAELWHDDVGAGHRNKAHFLGNKTNAEFLNDFNEAR